MSARPAATRRTVLRGAALTPVVGLGLTACGGGDDNRSAALAGPVELGPESEVAAGGAKLYRGHNVVVSRGEDGSLTAYNTVCTHAGCPINKLDGTRLVCPCHGSEFDVTTGKVLREPAVAPLKPLAVEVRNGTLVAKPLD
ncbi:Rieske (2Fe-2S) protein [Streptomyces griseoincarnatus]